MIAIFILLLCPLCVQVLFDFHYLNPNPAKSNKNKQANLLVHARTIFEDVLNQPNTYSERNMCKQVAKSRGRPRWHLLRDPWCQYFC